MKSIRPARSLSRRERGQSLVELAISLTVMLLLLAGAVTFGMALFSYVAIRDAAQEGALWGSFTPCLDASGATCNDPAKLNTAAIKERVRGASDSPVRLSDLSVVPDAYINVELSPSPANGGQPCEGTTGTDEHGSPVPNAVKVTVKYDYHIIMPFVNAMVGNDGMIQLTASVTDTILSPVCP